MFTLFGTINNSLVYFSTNEGGASYKNTVKAFSWKHSTNGAFLMTRAKRRTNSPIPIYKHINKAEKRTQCPRQRQLVNGVNMSFLKL